jgi:hypothetical protein
MLSLTDPAELVVSADPLDGRFVVDSTDRRNTLCELLSWSLILQGLAW